MADIKILVLQRGWVVVGRYEKQGQEVALTNASVVRRWGTSNGLGEIAKNGPLEDTKLDACNGTVRAHELAVVLSIDCAADKWEAAIAAAA